MKEENIDLIKEKCSAENFEKLNRLNNSFLTDFIGEFVELLNPKSIFVSSGSESDIQYIRGKAIQNGEEIKLAIKGHTAHFDGYYDQARDKEKTRLLIPKGLNLGSHFNTLDKEGGITEIKDIMKNIMDGKELYVLFYCLGPLNSDFSIPAVQLTDSSYVAHSENILYRQGYREFLLQGNFKHFFKFVHSAGELNNNVSKNIEKRRIYIDAEDNIVYSANTQYGGNTIGLKKLAMRLGINKGYKEGWLTEHMFVMGIHGPGNRLTYFAGAFPSMCGKTSTALTPGEKIIGDDIVYIKKINNKVKAVNVEVGIFGIIKDINPYDDTIIWDALHKPNEIIFSNVLVDENGGVFWIGKPGEIPEKGINYSVEWSPGKKDSKGNEIPPSHKNARFTIDLNSLENLDPRLEDPLGVELGGIIYGGRDSDIWVPVMEAYNWVQGIVTMGASLESETTAATLGKTGVRKFNPMSNLDFLSIPIGEYIDLNIKFGEKIENPPKIFSVNYFLKDEKGKYLNSIVDKRVWLKWMELRVHNDVGAIDIKIGLIPKYEDLEKLFIKVLNKQYSKDDYLKQFTLRVSENILKIERINKIYKEIGANVPIILFDILEEQKKKLSDLKKRYGTYIKPDVFE